MDGYTFSLLLGGGGLAAMALSGVGHGHVLGGRGHAAHAGHVHAGHAHAGATHAGAHGHGVAGQVAGALRGGRLRGRDGWSAWSLTSPLILFSLLLGVGATGVLLRHTLSGVTLFGASLVGGIVFERLFVSPLWKLALRFASNPALTLESCITDEATVVSSFDANGQGLISIELDGQVVQLLGSLPPDDVAGARPRTGDRVRIDDVDAARNRCTVSRL